MKYDEIRFIKPFKDADLECNPGQIKNFNKDSAKFLVDQGFAEYVNKKEINNSIKKRKVNKNNKKLTVSQLAMISEEDIIKGKFFDNDTFMAAKFVDSLLECYPMDTFITPINDQGGNIIWMYKEKKGIFENTGIPWIEEKVKNNLGEKVKKSYYSEVVKHLQVSTYTEPREFKEPPEIIVLENGAYNLYTDKLLSFSQEYKAKNALPIKYDPKAECPKFLKFLEKVIPTIEGREFFREWLGYHLLKDYRFQRVVVLQGDGDNGKSTLLALMVAFLGSENLATENLYRLSTNRFSPAELYGKLANIAADIGPDELKYTGIIKMLTGNDTITVERKNRDPFQFVNYAKMTFSCNQLPRTPDETLAFYKRFIVLVTGEPIPPEEQDPRLLEKLTKPEELSGILNWALVGLRRCLERGRLSEPTDIQERRDLYQNMSDPVNGFYNDFIEDDREGFEIKQDVLTAFYEYCKTKGFVPLSERKFIERFKKIAYVRNYKPKLWTDENPKGTQTHCWRGIKLSDACNKTPYWPTKEAYQSTHSNQKSLENIQDIQDIQGPQTKSKKVEKIGGVVDPGYGGYGGYGTSNVEDLVKKAEAVLKLNKGFMTQTAFYDHLEKGGHKRRDANYVLRSYPQFVFMGLNVKLVEASP